MISRPTAYIALGLFAAASGVHAQTIERTPEAAVADLRDGVIDHPRLFFFQGCPQVDPVGRRVLAAVESVDVTANAVFELSTALAWNGTYPDCDYPPLNAWFTAAFQRLEQDRDVSAMQMFVSSLPQSIAPDLQEALLRAAEDDALHHDVRSRLADAAIFKRPVDRQATEAVAAFQRSLPRDWIASATHRLGQRNEATFFEALIQAAPRLSDRVIEVVGSAIAADIRDGRIDAREDSIDRLRVHLRTRATIPPWAQIPPAGR